ncbi:heat shock protein class I (low molecular weight) [Anoxybacillus flavithermus]|nr:heat shock protein class I (low molecular weight) [Anoxybacillus flavithermus]
MVVHFSLVFFAHTLFLSHLFYIFTSITYKKFRARFTFFLHILRTNVYERATKSIFLPYPVSESDTQASFQDGKLIIRLPQRKTFIPIE